MSNPLRMCAVCRERKEKSQLLRVVRIDKNTFEIDDCGKLFGRGAYICKSETCIAKCKAKRLLNKSFKQEVPKEIYDKL